MFIHAKIREGLIDLCLVHINYFSMISCNYTLDAADGSRSERIPRSSSTEWFDPARLTTEGLAEVLLQGASILGRIYARFPVKSTIPEGYL